ncbi:hydroxyacid dehydrogenase [Candidatus Saccharibacteria bacterium]|nr:hydroxyacid dehydrogenase [Candidatus Saccharibacteria bacterium]
MATTIAFFDTTATEKVAFQRYFTGSKFKLHFFSETINEVPPYKYKDVDIISVFTPSNVDNAILAHLPNLQYITVRATGTNNVDLVACKKRKVAVSNVPAYGQVTVAEYTIMLMLMMVRKMPAVLDAVDEGQIIYRKLTGHTLHGKTIGIIGTGKIGISVAIICKALGMHVVAHDTMPNLPLQKKVGFSYLHLDDLLQGADIVSLHAPLTASTNYLINKKTLGLMSQHAILINTARGELVNTLDLIEALKNKVIAGAALDVVEGERGIDVDTESELLLLNKRSAFELAEADILSKMKNVIISPHNAFNSFEALHIIRKTSAQNIHGFLNDKLQNLVKPA